MTMHNTIGLIVATLGGAAIGLERQWSGHAEGPSARFAGLRTFTMLGAVGGLCGWLWTAGATLLAAILLAGAIAIITIAYVVRSRQDIDGTTEVAALVVTAAGLLAGLGSLQLASGIVAIEVLLLVEKSHLHAFVKRIDDVDLRAGVRFGVMALVVLPLLPVGPYGPFGGIRPRALWALVLFFSGLSFIGHLLRRGAGAERGYLLSGAVGGLISSTNVTLTFARLSRIESSMQRALAFGAIGANAMLYPRVLTATAVLNPQLVLPLLRYLGAPAVVAALAAAAGLRTSSGNQDLATPSPRNPLQLSAALQMAALFQVVITVVSVVRQTWGQTGILTTAAVLGLTDVDALTLSMARDVARNVSLDTAALAIAIGVLANTALKAGVALVFGSPTYRAMVAGALATMALAAVASILLR